MPKRKTPADVVAERAANMLLEQLKKGTKPWSSNLDGSTSHVVAGRPKSLGGYHYSNSTNEFVLSMMQHMNKGFGSKWASPKQIKARGGHITPGQESNGTAVLRTFKKYLDTRDNKVKLYPFDEDEAVRIGADKMPVRWTTIYSFVYNVAGQTKGMAAKYYPKPNTYDPADDKFHQKVSDQIDDLIKENQINVLHTKQGRSVFTPCVNLKDENIYIPKVDYFDGGYVNYASTLMHECTHYSGLKRLLAYNDSKVNKKTSHYATEELRAELTSVMLAGHFMLPVGEHMENHAAYIGSWIKEIENDPKIIIDICKDAGLGFEFLNRNKAEYQYLFDACENDFEKHVVAMCVAKSKSDPESMLEKIHDSAKAPPSFYVSRFHMASLACSHPESLNVSAGHKFNMNPDDEVSDQMVKAYHESVVNASSSIVQRLELSFENEYGHDKNMSASMNQNTAHAPSMKL